MKYKQDAPFAMQIELVEGCNLRCPFCGLNGIREPKNHNFKFMKPAVLASVLHQTVQLNWRPRVEFAMHGEPTMHEDYVSMVRVARESAPDLQLMMTSNGGGLLRGRGAIYNIAQLFEAGLNVLALDDYAGIMICTKIRAQMKEYKEALAEAGVQIYEYPRDPMGNPHMRRAKSAMVVTLIEDISKAAKGTHASLNNHAGAGAPKNDSMQGKRCAKPFREISIRWDGNVAICCNDWRGLYKCGNVHTEGLEAVWNGAAFVAARKKLYHGERDFGACDGCDAKSYRTGLLPDKFGKVKLPRVNTEDERAIKQAQTGAPYTKPVLRPWEKNHA